jgi:hypothetical protein
MTLTAVEQLDLLWFKARTVIRLGYRREQTITWDVANTDIASKLPEGECLFFQLRRFYGYFYISRKR